MTIEVTNVQPPERKLSQQLKAVLLILEADHDLMSATRPFIDLNLESVYWDDIFRLPLCSTHKMICEWAFAVWKDEIYPGSNPFDSALKLQPKVQMALLAAFAFRWGLSC